MINIPAYIFFRKEDPTEKQQRRFGNQKVWRYQFKRLDMPFLDEDSLREIIEDMIDEGKAEAGEWRVQEKQRGQEFTSEGNIYLEVD